MKKRSLLGLVAAVPLVFLAGCGGSSEEEATVRLLNASAGYSSVDLYVEDEKEIGAIGFGTMSDYVGVASGDVTAEFTNAGSTTALLTKSLSLGTDDAYTIVTYGWEGAIKSVIITENQDDADSDESSVSVLNTAVDAGALDIYLTATDESLDSSTPVLSNVSGGSRSSFATVKSGTYRLRITGYGDTSDLRLDIAEAVISSTGVYTFVLTPGSGGVLVNSLMLKQGGALTQQLNTKARARVVAGMASGGKVTVKAGSTSLATAAASPAIKDYALIDAGDVTLTTSVDGTTLTSTTQTIKAGSDTTLLVTGNSAADATVKVLSDDNRLPTVSTKFKMRLVHAAPSLASDALTLTLDLEDLVTDLTWGTSSSFVSRTGTSSSSLEVNSLSSTTPVFSVTEQAYLSNSIYTVFVYDTSAGVATAKVKKDR